MDATVPQGSPGGRTSFAGFVIFVGIFLAVLMGGMDALVVSTALPTIATDLHQANGITFVVGAYIIASTVAIPVFARLSDSMSRRNLFVIGLLVFIAGSMLAGLSTSLPELIAFRAVQGFGIGGLFPVAIAMVAVLYPRETRSRMTAALTGAAGISIVGGPLLGSYILDVTTWRWVFYINLPIGVASLLILALGAGALRPARSLRFDVVGAATLGAWVGSLMFALVQVSEAGWAWSDPRVVGLLAFAAVAFVAFFLWELRVPDPLVPIRMLRRRILAASGGSALFNGAVLNSALTFLSVYVGVVLFHGGPDAPDMVRDMIYFFALPMITGAALSAPLLERFSYRVVVAGGLALGAVSCLFLTDLTVSTPLWVLRYGFLPTGGVVVPLIPMGLGLGLALAGTTIAVQNEVPESEVGSAVGLVRFLQSLGGAVGLSLLTAYQVWRKAALSSAAKSPADLASALITSYDEVFVALVGVLVIAFLFALFFTGRLSRRAEAGAESSPAEPGRSAVLSDPRDP